MAGPPMMAGWCASSSSRATIPAVSVVRRALHGSGGVPSPTPSSSRFFPPRGGPLSCPATRPAPGYGATPPRFFPVPVPRFRRGFVSSPRREQQQEEVCGVASVPVDQIPPPTFRQKRIYAVQCAVPMIGFGFIDNLIMIQAGDFIDATLGVTFGLATITAAAMGQICSDVSGVAFGGMIDALFGKLGLPVADLTTDQLTLGSVRFVRTAAMALGVFSGCLLGMTSLLFMDLDKKERLKKQKQLETILATMAREGSDLCNVDRCSLYIVEDDLEHAWTAAQKLRVTDEHQTLSKKFAEELGRAAVNGQVAVRLVAECMRKLGWRDADIVDAVPDRDSLLLQEAVQLLQTVEDDETRVPLQQGGTKHWVVHNQRLLNVRDIASDNRFAQSSMRQMKAGLEPARSLLIAPVFADDPDGGGVVDGDMGPGKKVVGVVEMVNKKNERGAVVAFNSDDEKLVRMLAHHSSTFIHLDDD